MPLTSSFYTFYTGAQTGDKSQMAWGLFLMTLDWASFGEGSTGIKALDVGLDGLLHGAGKFTLSQIDNYVFLATKIGQGANKEKVLLGEFVKGSLSSYEKRALNEGYTFFSMETEIWSEAKSLVNGSKEEMWKINKQFIDEQKALGKEFWFSHDPFSPGNDQYFASEVNYLIDLGVKDFKKIGDVWKAVW